MYTINTSIKDTDKTNLEFFISNLRFGLNILIGMPRSGKTTFMTDCHRFLGEDRSIFLRVSEFDAKTLSAATMRGREVMQFTKEYMKIACYSCKEYLIIDSIKAILFISDGKEGLRVGGISNSAMMFLNELYFLAKQYGIKLLCSISTTSNDIRYVNEILNICLGSCDNLAYASVSHKIYFNEHRFSALELTKALNEELVV